MGGGENIALDPPTPGDAEAAERSAQPTFRFTSNIAGQLVLIADLFSFLVSAPIAFIAYDLLIGAFIVQSVHLFALVAMLGCFLLIRSSKYAYRRSHLLAASSRWETAGDVLVSSLLASALVWLMGMGDHYSRGLTILFLLSLVTVMEMSRLVLRSVMHRLSIGGVLEQRVALYGADSASSAMISELLATAHLKHLKIVGVADDRPGRPRSVDLPMIGGFAELTQMARRGEIDQVLICAPNLSRKRLHEIMEGLSEVSVDVSLIPSEAIAFAPDYRVNLLGSVPVLTLWQRPFRDINHFIKRGEDLLIGSLALTLVAPILLAAAALIKFTSSGPILFVQPRIGFNNELIHVFKLRTMYADRTDLVGSVTTARDDPRITPVGRLMRKFSIDELPQLLNVIRGEMSLVGPRPHATHMKVGDQFYQNAVRGYAGRHRVKPGITGLAQVKGLRGEIRTIERAKRRVDLDKQYIDRWSLGLDIWILLATARAVLFDADAY